MKRFVTTETLADMKANAPKIKILTHSANTDRHRF